MGDGLSLPLPREEASARAEINSTYSYKTQVIAKLTQLVFSYTS